MKTSKSYPRKIKRFPIKWVSGSKKITRLLNFSITLVDYFLFLVKLLLTASPFFGAGVRGFLL